MVHLCQDTGRGTGLPTVANGHSVHRPGGQAFDILASPAAFVPGLRRRGVDGRLLEGLPTHSSQSLRIEHSHHRRLCRRGGMRSQLESRLVDKPWGNHGRYPLEI